MPVALPFEDSRRLTGFNLYFADVGAVLETVGVAADDVLLREWKARVRRMRAALGWPDKAIAARVHASGASLAFAAPVDQLFSATEVNEWAWLATVFPLSRSERREAFHAPGYAAAWDEDSALHTLLAFARGEHRDDLVGLVQAAEAHALNVLIDDEILSIGSGRGVRQWPLVQLPQADTIDWDGLHDVPIALVTGSNGKTTTTRLLAAIVRAHGLRSGHSCTDGLFVDGKVFETGDYSGPAGARAVLRHPTIEAAILETARGGILRRGIAVQRANVAVVTNVSADHYGEYGIHDLDDLAEVKLSVAHTLDVRGMLVLNADDAMLVRHVVEQPCARAWFALDDAHPLLRAHREHSGATCGVRDGRLHLFLRGVDHDLGDVAAMPLSFAASATYNIANIAAAALAAAALGISADTIAGVLAHFGAEHADNPGRLEHWALGGVRVFVDYAHNPDGLRGLLGVATARRDDGRLGLVLGQAGNREDAEIRELAAVAASFRPDHIVLKDIDGMLRGRAAGEVPTILRDELRQHGLRDGKIAERLDEFEAAREMLAWARRGDTLVLPIHGKGVRQRVGALLDQLQDCDWIAGTPLPPV